MSSSGFLHQHPDSPAAQNSRASAACPPPASAPCSSPSAAAVHRRSSPRAHPEVGASHSCSPVPSQCSAKKQAPPQSEGKPK